MEMKTVAILSAPLQLSLLLLLLLPGAKASSIPDYVLEYGTYLPTYPPIYITITYNI